jgi:hypothetical protein
MHSEATLRKGTKWVQSNAALSVIVVCAHQAGEALIHGLRMGLARRYRLEGQVPTADLGLIQACRDTGLRSLHAVVG